ncbi:BatA domain-containing protein [Xanthomarina spongicola]|uniref:Putative membrane protein (TIGR02226 family) n=1 Tax=Xanthomarina spongicola TaxID=570520 RepID=A0A316DPB1_9FLAO|nr:BatA domain-containing protein [Xanthomarina spongicola]PWK19795.1 putative membrane protein (TIGR02226 family) [Xanthomarina spongicola]
MQFKHPELLYALFALLIPIIIHLFQLRKFKKEVFTNVAFLKKVTSQTRKSSQLKKWLILTARMLLLAALILAFAQPYTSKTNTFNTKKETVIYLDNSFSMQAKGEQGELFKRAIQDLIENIDESEKITLFTNNATYRNTSIDAIKNELLQLDFAPSQLSYDAVLLKCKNLFSPDSGILKQAIIISDFQIKETQFNPSLDSIININTVQLKPVSTNNLQIDSLFISNQTATNLELTVNIINQGNVIENVPVSLYSEGQLITKTSINIEETAVANFTLSRDQKIIGEIVIDDSNLPFDNSLFFNINKPNKAKVLSISESNEDFLKRVYTDGEFQLNSTILNELNYSQIENQNLIILNELESIPSSLKTALISYTNNGGFVLIIPSTNNSLQTYNDFLLSYNIQMSPINKTEKKVTTINYSHPLYSDVFNKRVTNFQYPKVSSYYPINSRNTTAPLQFEDGNPFLASTSNVFVFASALNSENSNFKNSPLIVPTLYNIGKQSLKTSNLYYTIGEENTFDIPVILQQDEILSLSFGEENIIPQQQYFNNKVSIITNEIPTIAGTYNVNNKTELIENVSYNYNRKESSLQYQDLSSINHINQSDSVAKLFDTLKSDSKINELWKWFVIFALVFLAIEMLILKYFK